MSFFISNQARSINFEKKRNLEEYIGGGGGLHCPKSVGGNSFHFLTTCKIKKVVVFKNVVREYFVQNFFKEYAYFSLRMMSFFQKSVVEVEVVGGGGVAICTCTFLQK